MFKSRHPACDAKAESLKNELRDLVSKGALAGQPFSELNAEAEIRVQENKLRVAYFQEIMLKAANDAATEIAQKSAISEEELTRLVDLLKGFGFPEGNRDAILQHKYFGMAFASMSNKLWDVQNDRLPYFDGTGRTQFNLQGGESQSSAQGK